jgi:hypothetical protein
LAGKEVPAPFSFDGQQEYVQQVEDVANKLEKSPEDVHNALRSGKTVESLLTEHQRLRGQVEEIEKTVQLAKESEKPVPVAKASNEPPSWMNESLQERYKSAPPDEQKRWRNVKDETAQQEFNSDYAKRWENGPSWMDRALQDYHKNLPDFKKAVQHKEPRGPAGHPLGSCGFSTVASSTYDNEATGKYL